MITTTPNEAQAENRVGTTPEQAAAEAHMNPVHEVTRLRTEIEDARDGLGNYVSELDRRRHSALNLKLQLKKHKALAIGVGVVTVAAAAGAVARIVRSRRSALPSSGSAGRLAAAVGQKPRRLAGFLLGTAVPVRSQSGARCCGAGSESATASGITQRALLSRSRASTVWR